jgi:dihydroneopterin aldolase
MDVVFLEGMDVPCRISCAPGGRDTLQSLRADVRMYCASLEQAGKQDSVGESVDFRIAREMIAAVQGKEFHIIEAVAEIFAAMALRHPLVQKVEVTLCERGAAVGAERAGIQITRSRA